MQELEKILEEIDQEIEKERTMCEGIEDTPGWRLYEKTMKMAKHIICKHLSCENGSEITRLSRDSICGECSRRKWYLKGYEDGKKSNDGWIPVDKGTPEVGEYVLGTNKYGEVLVYHYGWNSPHTRKMFFCLCGAATTITAWRPLPEPYKPERMDQNEKAHNQD